MKKALILLVGFAAVAQAADTDVAMLSTGRTPESTQQRVSEIRAAERRAVPLDVGLQASSSYKAHDPIDVTITLTNLFDAPLILNSRMLVNHPLLPGEVYFQIVGPDGNRLEVQHLATPRPVQEEDFVVLQRGHSIQRTLDLADLYGVKKKGVYRLRVCYHNEIDHNIKGQLAWHGSLFSDPIEIQVN